MFFKSHPITIRGFQEPHPFEIYTPAGKGPFPVIFQTPILGRIIFLEDLFFERRFARFFARQGIACILIHRPIFEFDPRQGLEQIQGYIENSLKRNQQVFESVLGNSEIDLQRMGTFGISFGGIINCLWAALEERLKVHVFALAGGNLPEIFMRSEDPLMRSYQKAARAAVGGNLGELKQHLISIFTRDPLTAAANLSPSNIMMILGIFDRVVPFALGKELRKKLGNPKTIFIPLGHFFSILAVPLVKWQAVHFFKIKFSIPKEGSTSCPR